MGSLFTVTTKRKLSTYLLLTFIFTACAPKLKSNLNQSFTPLSQNALVVVLDITDDQIIASKNIGELKAVDNGFSENCTYYETVENLKRLARAAGANLIRITKQKNPDKWSTCHRLWAEAFKVENPQAYETHIEWRADRKLTWDDFKGEPDLENFPEALAVTNSGFSYETGINLFKKGKVFVKSMFNTNLSWVLPQGRTDFILRHEQVHFDITEIYSRKLRKELADAGITSENITKGKPIFDRISIQLQKRQDKYDRETKRGSKQETQENWEAIIEIELAKYDLYKTND